MNTIPVVALHLAISEYFRNNPGVITEQYVREQAARRKLLELEKYCAAPGAWYETDQWVDGYPGEEYTVHQFYFRNLGLLEEHEYADDGVYVHIEEDGTKILELSVECH